MKVFVYLLLLLFLSATITLVIAWTVVSAYLGVGVGVADICAEPEGKLPSSSERIYAAKQLCSLLY